MIERDLAVVSGTGTPVQDLLADLKVKEATGAARCGHFVRADSGQLGVPGPPKGSVVVASDLEDQSAERRGCRVFGHRIR
ncbi:hypothetical protein [Streptomyces puniciscabiei]|uniref:hypothetical protein n=1 Tax=Streptomyces puniciscabiei TaxID=164348 RepID=UPI000A723713|nr:hypothetical protein [Streptomyces puniciscabiei]